MDNCIKILIADADEGFTSDLACYLKTNSSFDVVGAANDGEKAVRLLRTTQPNVLILDLLLPKLDGLSGSSGWTTGSHLHLGVYIDGEAVDPLAFLMTEDA